MGFKYSLWYTKSQYTVHKTENMLSVNQTAAQIKLTEMWKCKNKPDYPLNPPKMERTENGTATRSVTTEKLNPVLVLS